MHAPHPSTACRTPSTGAGPLSVPVHARSHVPPRCARHHGSTHFRSGSATPWVVQDDSWLFEYVLAESVSTVPASSCTPVVFASGSRVQNHVRPPLLTSSLCPDHGTSERFCTHPACAACGPSTNASHPHRPSPDGAASAPPARAHPCAALLRSRGCCTRLRCGLATPGIVGDLHRRDLYVRDGVVATLPCTSCISSARRRELVAAGR